jgi:hypothetical protein
VSIREREGASSSALTVTQGHVCKEFVDAVVYMNEVSKQVPSQNNKH